LDENAAVAATSFDQKHARLGILGQSVSQHATSGTGADNDVIKLF
jgi:hypothetical protein